MFEGMSRIAGLTHAESKEYRSLRGQLRDLILDELILQCGLKGERTITVIEQLHRLRDEGGKHLLSKLPFATMHEVHQRIFTLSNQHLLERRSSLERIGQYEATVQFVDTLDKGRARLSELSEEIERAGLRFSELEERHLTSGDMTGSWWDKFTSLFPGS